MRESSLWNTLHSNLKKRRQVIWDRIENSVGSGMADLHINYVDAVGDTRSQWIELKHITHWPKRPTTRIKVVFQPGQIPWLSKRNRVTGNSWVLLQVAKEYFFFDGNQEVLVQLADGVLREELLELAFWTGDRLSGLLTTLGVKQ